MTLNETLTTIYQSIASSLPPLVDVTDDIVVTDDTMTEEERNVLVETCACLIADYVEANPLVMSKPDYATIIRNNVIELLEETIPDDLLGSIAEEEVMLIYQLASYIVFTTVLPKRSYKKTFIRKHRSSPDVIRRKLQDIRERPQSEQCTPQWYEDRWNRLSGSNAWKAFGSESQVNSLIYEKCKPIDTSKYQNVNTESSLHHGKRFEPVSTQCYEYMYGAKVEEFGCVPHKTHSFLGASPDGIVVNEDCPRYGRMLEIKNVTTRVINGVPKEDYWTQMQIQMEVCDLNECDFLETEIYTYPSYEEFAADGTFQKSINGKFKGVITQYLVDGKPYYEYSPFQCSQEEFEAWGERISEEHASHTWITNIYYRIDTISCVLVLRNKIWMSAAIGVLRDVWTHVLYDRENGYEHRQPKSRVSAKGKNASSAEKHAKSNCIINVKKLQTDMEVDTGDDDGNASADASAGASAGASADVTVSLVSAESPKAKKRKTNNRSNEQTLFVDIGSNDL